MTANVIMNTAAHVAATTMSERVHGRTMASARDLHAITFTRASMRRSSCSLCAGPINHYDSLQSIGISRKITRFLPPEPYIYLKLTDTSNHLLLAVIPTGNKAAYWAPPPTTTTQQMFVGASESRRNFSLVVGLISRGDSYLYLQSGASATAKRNRFTMRANVLAPLQT